MELRDDPFPGYNFLVLFDHLPLAGFSEVSGISPETEVEEIKEGGQNEFVHKLPKQTQYGNLILKRGLSINPFLFMWYRDVVQGKIEPKDITILLLNHLRIPIRWWTFYKTIPVKWVGPEFNSTSNETSFETIELTHQGMSLTVI